VSGTQFVVTVREHGTVFGPFALRTDADRFARFITQEVDFAEVRTLCSPVLELLEWRDRVPQRLADPWPAGPLAVEQCSPAQPSEGVRIVRDGKVLSRVQPRDALLLAHDLISAAIHTEEEPPF
jgi:hypothetical protein